MRKKSRNERISIISQGCRLNHSETAQLINEFKSNGKIEVKLNEAPDIVIINTCTVTENGDKDTIKLINKINKLNTNTKIALIGCQSQIKQRQLFDYKSVHWVIGNEEKKDTADIILNRAPGLYMNKFEKKPFFQHVTSFDPRHTRVNLKIQDGCDFYCSFCIIPFARGPARSRDYYNIIDDAKKLIRIGIKELVLTGINLGTYENQGHNFYDLLDELLSISKLTRIRISSIEPTTINDHLIHLWKKHTNFCRYLHLPMQSGSDSVLKKMRRKYTVEEYDDYVNLIKNKIPNICIGTDIIVGFPGESNDLFEETKTYLETSPINYFHVFSYSERTMAHSRKFNDQIDPSVIKHRSQVLRELHKKKWADYLFKKKGTITQVLFEQKKKDHWIGSTEDFIKVQTTSTGTLKNKMKYVKLIEIKDSEMIGVI